MDAHVGKGNPTKSTLQIGAHLRRDRSTSGLKRRLHGLGRSAARLSIRRPSALKARSQWDRRGGSFALRFAIPQDFAHSRVRHHVEVAVTHMDTGGSQRHHCMDHRTRPSTSVPRSAAPTIWFWKCSWASLVNAPWAPRTVPIPTRVADNSLLRVVLPFSVRDAGRSSADGSLVVRRHRSS